MRPDSELITAVRESASDIAEHQTIRDRQRFQFEKHKLALFIVLILSLWIMFFLLWKKLDELRPATDAPAGENHPAPPEQEPHYVI